MHRANKWSPKPESKQSSSHKKSLRLIEEDKENVVPDAISTYSKSALKSPISSTKLSLLGEKELGSPFLVKTSPGLTRLQGLSLPKLVTDQKGLSSDFKAPAKPFSPDPQRCRASPKVRAFGLSRSNSSPQGSKLGRRALPKMPENAINLDDEKTVMCISDDEDGDSPVDADKSDGFDICRLRFLDSVNGSPVSVVSESECDSPFLGSLISSKMVISMDDEVTKKLKAATEGSSPLLASQPQGPSRSYSLLKLRRCTSMVLSRESKGITGQMNPLSTILEFSPTESKACQKRPVPFLDEVDTDSQQKPTKKQKMSEVASRPHCQKLNLQLPSFNPADNSNLTADSRRKLLLPTILGNSNNRDLNNIDCETLADLMTGKFNDQVESFRVIDARFAYEFNGGHIRGAENFGCWNEEDFLAEFFPSSLTPKPLACWENFTSQALDLKRRILIFHCEFSSERGPKLIRFLRKRDRDQNRDSYPALHYPEVYLLHGGYKAFFALYPELCEPKSYVPMNHPDFIKEERKFHKRSRTWQAGGSVARTGHLQLTRGQSTRELDKYKRSISDSPCLGKKSLFNSK